MLRSIRVHHLAVLFILALAGLFMTQPKNTLAVTGADWRAGKIIDDSVFYNNGDMTTGDIQNFLNSKVTCDTWGTKPSEYGGGTRAQYGASRGYPAPYTCLKDYSQNGKSAAQIIKEAADTYRISSKSLIVLLQKEQALVTDEWPWSIQYRSATGYGCPDTAPCDAEYYGFQNQVMKAAYQFRRYATYPSEYRYKPYQNNAIQFNPNSGCGSTNVYIENLATAGLYNYTPYQPNSSALSNLYGTGDGCGAYGNRNFWRLFNDWFGGTRSNRCFEGSPSAAITGVTFRKYQPRIEQANLVIYTGSSTNCIESHTWNIGVTSWASHTATNHPIAPPDVANVQYADLNGDSIDEPILMSVRDTASGFVEFHIWNRDMNQWVDHIISPIIAGDYSNGKITFADTDGNGKDEPILILYSGTGSGKVEFHVVSDDLRTWRTHAATHLNAITTSTGSINFGDLDGNGRDEAILTLYNSTGSGMVEFHTWTWNWRDWRFQTASNLPNFTPADAYITFADVDGNSVDEAVLIVLRNTQSNMVEFHTWNQGVKSWRYHTASNQPSL